MGLYDRAETTARRFDLVIIGGLQSQLEGGHVTGRQGCLQVLGKSFEVINHRGCDQIEPRGRSLRDR